MTTERKPRNNELTMTKRAKIPLSRFASIVFSVSSSVLGVAFAEEVEYVESTGTQYFNTGIVPSSTTRMVVDAAFMKHGSAQYMGWAASNPGEAFLFGANDGGRPYGIVTPSDYLSPVLLTNTYLGVGVRHRWGLSSGAQSLDGVVCKSGTIGDTAKSGNTLYLFARHHGWGAEGDAEKYDCCCNLRMYSCQIYEGDTLVKDYVPFRNADGLFGLSNRVDGVFQTATGGMLYGPVDIPVEYVEATGEQHLDIEYVPSEKTRLIADIQYTVVPASLAASGWHSQYSKEAFVFGVDGGYFKTCVNPTNVWQDSGVSADTKRRVFDIQSGSQKLGIVENGETNFVQFATSTYSDPDHSAESIFLFARHAKWVTEPIPEVNGWCSMRIYGLRIYENGELVRDFVPCVRNGRAGLKDVLSHSFKESVEFGLKRPAETVEYDFVASDFAQYLKTGVVPSSATRIVTDFQYTMVTGMCANGWSGDNAESLCFGILSNRFAAAFMANGYKTLIPIIFDGQEVSFDMERHTFDLKSGSQKFDDREFGANIIGDSASYGQQMYLFARQSEWSKSVAQGSSSGYAAMRIFSCQIYSGDTLVRDFVPCTSDGVAGMLDRVTGVFMPSETAFPLVVGNLDRVEQQLYYIEGTGSQYINTRHVPCADTRIVTELRFRELTGSSHQIMGWAATNPGEAFLFGITSDGYFGGCLNMNYSSITT